MCIVCVTHGCLVLSLISLWLVLSIVFNISWFIISMVGIINIVMFDVIMVCIIIIVGISICLFWVF